MGKPKSVFFNPTTNETIIESMPSKRRDENTDIGNRFSQNVQNIISENSESIPRRNKPESVFNQSEDLADSLNEQSFNIDTISDILINDEIENNKVSFQISTENFQISDGRIKGTVNILSTQKTQEEYGLNLQFSPLDLKQNVFNEKTNVLHFKSDLTESIQINETSDNLKNISIEIQIIKNNKVISKSSIEVLETDSQDFPDSTKKTDYTKYAIIGIGLIGLLIIFKTIRGKTKT